MRGGSSASARSHTSAIMVPRSCAPERARPEISPEIAAWIDPIRKFNQQVWAEFDLERLRIRGEDKELIVSYHWRGAPDETAAETAIEEIESRAREAGLITHRGRMVLEIRPGFSFGKDVGVARLLEEADVDRALYMGDDRTDADAFSELHLGLDTGRLAHAACIGVASLETPAEVEQGADLLVDGPDGVRRCPSTAGEGLTGSDAVRGLPEGHRAAQRGLSEHAGPDHGSRRDPRAGRLARSSTARAGGWRRRCSEPSSGAATHASPAITRLLADARNATMMPEIHPGAVLLNRLWPLLLATIVAGRAGAVRASDRRDRDGLRDHLGALLAPSGQGRARDRGARRAHVLRRAHLAAAADAARADAGAAPRGSHLASRR